MRRGTPGAAPAAGPPPLSFGARELSIFSMFSPFPWGPFSFFVPIPLSLFQPRPVPRRRGHPVPLSDGGHGGPVSFPVPAVSFPPQEHLHPAQRVGASSGVVFSFADLRAAARSITVSVGSAFSSMPGIEPCSASCSGAGVTNGPPGFSGVGDSVTTASSGTNYLVRQPLRIFLSLLSQPTHKNTARYMRNHLGLTIKTAGADSAYGTSLICQVLDDMGISLYTPGITGGVNYKAEFTREDFEYQKETDCFICPGGKRLVLRSLEREEFKICRVYRAERKPTYRREPSP